MTEVGRDLRDSLAAWRAAPMLPLLTAVLGVGAAVGTVDPRWTLLSLPVAVFALGFYGTQRLWYAAVFTGREFAPARAWRLSWTMLRRFLALGLLVGVPALLVLAPAYTVRSRSAAIAATVVVSVVVDLLLTFVTPALVFSSEQAVHAFAIGMTMIRGSGRRCAVYVLAPPITVQLVGWISPARLGAAGALLAAITALFSLWWKGATVRYYLRVAPSLIPDPVDPGGVGGGWRWSGSSRRRPAQAPVSWMDEPGAVEDWISDRPAEG